MKRKKVTKKVAKKTANKPAKKTVAKKTVKVTPKKVAKKPAKSAVKKKSVRAEAKKVQQDIRIGIFGGSFNPFHNGHLNSLLTVAQKMNLEKVFLVPSFQSPGKPMITSPNPQERLEMAELAASEYPDLIVADSQEIVRGGESFTVDTIKKYIEEYPSENIYLIVGADVFANFTAWKDYQKLLTLCNLVVTSRPGSFIPFQKDDYVPEIRDLIDYADVTGAQLRTGRSIFFVQLDDLDVSGTEIRKCLRTGLKVDKYLPFPVEKYIRAKGLYQTGGVKISDYGEFTKFCARALFDKKAVNLKAFDLRRLNNASEFTIVVSGTSTRHAAALGEYVIDEVKKEFGVVPLSVEGLRDGRWVLLDYGSLIIHIFYDFVRGEYNIEELFEDGVDMKLVDTGLTIQPRA